MWQRFPPTTQSRCSPSVPGTHLVICSGMLRSLNRPLASSAGCTVKHWMSARVKEPWAPPRDGAAGSGARGDPMGVRDPRGGRGQRERAAHPALSPRSEDTLARGAGDVLSRWRRGRQLFSVGERAQQPHLEVLTPLVLLAPVDEDLVLGGGRRQRVPVLRSPHPVLSCSEPRGAGADKAEPPARGETPFPK